MRLLPRDEKFWEYFATQTGLMSQASECLLNAIQGSDAELAGAAVRLKSIERESFTVLCELQTKLHKTFVTPLDPEDISSLSEHLDHLIDQIEGISYRLAAYSLKPLPSLMTDLARNVRKFAGLFDQAFKLLAESKSTEQLCGQVFTTEEETGLLIREGVTKLFAEDANPISVMKKKEIYDLYESFNDSCQELANTLQNVSVKNA